VEQGGERRLWAATRHQGRLRNHVTCSNGPCVRAPPACRLRPTARGVPVVVRPSEPAILIRAWRPAETRATRRFPTWEGGACRLAVGAAGFDRQRGRCLTRKPANPVFSRGRSGILPIFGCPYVAQSSGSSPVGIVQRRAEGRPLRSTPARTEARTSSSRPRICPFNLPQAWFSRCT
jgi:hypothetical protein